MPPSAASPSSSTRPASAAPPSGLAHWDDVAIVLTDVTGKRLQAVSAAAGRAGVRAGMRPTEARALCADLHELPWDDLAIGGAITAASAELLGASPQVTPVAGAPGLWWVGASGFDGVGGERTLAHALLRIARRWHPRPRVAIAGSCVAARAATWAGASFEQGADDHALVHVVPLHHDAAYLAPAPLALVPMDEELRAALQALGLRTVGALAALPADDVERRWGEIGLRAWRLANADDARRPVLARVETQPAIEVVLSSPAMTTEPVLFLVRAALDRLVHEMIAHGRAVAAIAITLTLDDARGALVDAPAHTVTREARAAKPLARVLPLFERCRALLDGWTLEAPVIAVRVAIVATAPLSGEQGDLLTTSWRDLGAADAALERLRAELGAGAIVRAQAQDTHRPERAGVWRDALDVTAGVAPRDRASIARAARVAEPAAVAAGSGAWSAGAASASGASGSASASSASASPAIALNTIGTATIAPATLPAGRPLRMLADTPSPPVTASARRALDPPEEVEVTCDGEVPRTVTWRGQHIAITRALGPERLSGDWWDDGYRRDYWRCESLAGEVVVFLDRATDGWALQAWAD
jgi:protein ImuB